nr:DUF4123 domain-containing protein [uncultured Massilia sp.]
MLIDAFAEDWLGHLDKHCALLSSGFHLYLLLDGACVPGLHHGFPSERKVILFDSLPGCNQNTRDASPFVTPYDRADRWLKSMLRQCSGWPMVSAIITSESLSQLAERLRVWCIVEADIQRFNFRFPDTRRLPAILSTLNFAQRKQLTGPAVSWSYVGRDGLWYELDVVTSSNAAAAKSPTLNAQQFSALVDDSQADELMGLLHHHGRDVFSQPSKSHALLVIALRAARLESLEENNLVDWCEWYWKQNRLTDLTAAVSSLAIWKKDIENDQLQEE